MKKNLCFCLTLLLCACAALNGCGSRVAGATSQVVYGYIREINPQARTITLDPVELVSKTDRERTGRLGLDEETPSFDSSYVYNAQVQHRMYPLDPQASFDLTGAEGGSLRVDSTRLSTDNSAGSRTPGVTNRFSTGNSRVGTNGSDGTTGSGADVGSGVSGNTTGHSGVGGTGVTTEIGGRSLEDSGLHSTPGLSSDLTEEETDSPEDLTLRAPMEEEMTGDSRSLENGNGLGASSGGMAGVLELSDPEGNGELGPEATRSAWNGWDDQTFDRAVNSITQGLRARSDTLFAVTLSNGKATRITRMD